MTPGISLPTPHHHHMRDQGIRYINITVTVLTAFHVIMSEFYRKPLLLKQYHVIKILGLQKVYFF